MSDFTIYCPSCGHGLVATDDIVGQKAQCPNCEAHFIVPEPQLPAKAARPRFCVKSTAGMEAGIRHRLPFVTVALMSISILMMVCIISKTGQLEPDARLLVSWGASFRPLTFGGQFWRLITSAFVHFNIMHAAMNMLCLFSIGKTLETLVGHLKVAEIYFLTAITGGLFSCMFHADVICAGASGAVFGMFGAEITYLTLLHEKLGLSSNEVVGHIKGGLVFVGINFAYSLLPGVDMAAHAGGLIGGIAIGATIALASKKGIEEVVNWSMSGLAILAVFVLAISLSTGRNAGRLDLANLKAEVSKMLVDNLNKNCENGCSFEVIDIALMRGRGNRYNGDVEMSFKCGGNVYPMKSRIEVLHDAMGTSYKLNSDDFANWQKTIQVAAVDVDALKDEVSQILVDNVVKGLKKEGCKNVSVKVKCLSLVNDGDGRYHGRVEIECRYDGEDETIKSSIEVKYDGKTIAYELKEEPNLQR